eukprot:TRINITY_DN166_c0_g1_i1.p1 TRINITY_DN166_c0_g1~~TRINITY_DN166_c0_g1_i1.p1  ORF type:complete len:306 (-),score=41.60 TRINITY_DN166_c0_g1_i1:27-923(-)
MAVWQSRTPATQEWLDYSPSNSELLESAFHNGDDMCFVEVELGAGGTGAKLHFAVDFTEFRQYNRQGFSRRVRRSSAGNRTLPVIVPWPAPVTAPALHVILTGLPGAGKDGEQHPWLPQVSMANSILGYRKFRTGISPNPITTTAQSAWCTLPSTGQCLAVWDTPGLFDGHRSTLQEFQTALFQARTGRVVILLCVSIDRRVDTATHDLLRKVPELTAGRGKIFLCLTNVDKLEPMELLRWLQSVPAQALLRACSGWVAFGNCRGPLHGGGTPSKCKRVEPFVMQQQLVTLFDLIEEM